LIIRDKMKNILMKFLLVITISTNSILFGAAVENNEVSARNRYIETIVAAHNSIMDDNEEISVEVKQQLQKNLLESLQDQDTEALRKTMHSMVDKAQNALAKYIEEWIKQNGA